MQKVEDDFCHECNEKMSHAWCRQRHNGLQYVFCSFICRDMWKGAHSRYAEKEK
jgi:hypothetical protein